MLTVMKALCSLAFLLLLIATPAAAHVAVDDMAAAANKFLQSLKPEQMQKATFQWKDDERQNWHYIPKARKGLPFKEMTADQRQLGLKLLQSGMSEHGHRKASQIMSLETILRELEGANSRMV